MKKAATPYVVAAMCYQVERVRVRRLDLPVISPIAIPVVGTWQVFKQLKDDERLSDEERALKIQPWYASSSFTIGGKYTTPEMAVSICCYLNTIRPGGYRRAGEAEVTRVK